MMGWKKGYKKGPQQRIATALSGVIIQQILCASYFRRYQTYFSSSSFVSSDINVWISLNWRYTEAKRTVPLARLEQMTDEIEQNLQNSLEREITTDMVGEQVMEKLRGVDEVAYVRFASVYRQFKDIHTFMSELTKLLEEK